MLSRNALVSAVAFSCLLVAHSATAQPRWGRERLPNAGACFYEDRDFRGQYFCVQPGERLGALPRDMGDKISSMRLLGAHEVTVFRDSNWHGRSVSMSRSGAAVITSQDAPPSTVDSSSTSLR